MKKILLVFSFLVFLHLGIFALGPQELVRVNFYNETGRELKHLFASSTNSDFWGPDLLGSKSLEFGGMSSFLLHFWKDQCLIDFLAIDVFNDTYILPARYFFSGKEYLVSFGMKDRKGRLPALELTQIYINNASTRTFSVLFFSQLDAEDWGFDLLNDSSKLGPGASISFCIPSGPDKTYWDLYALAEDASSTRRHISLSKDQKELFIDIMNTDLH